MRTVLVKEAIDLFDAQDSQELDFVYEGGIKDAITVATTLARFVKSMPEGFEWINKRAVVRGEDFEYKAVVLCSFPKTNGKVRYIVEDNGRIFIQRKDQITFIEDRPFNP